MTPHHPIRKLVAPESPLIPDKLYFRIGDVARLCDVPAYVLRFWETEFPQLKPNKGGTGQRLYRKRDVEMALRIKSLLYDQGYTIPGARQVFKSEASKPAPDATQIPPEVAAISPPPQTEVDMGETIRHEAQHRDQLSTLREELRSIADLLSHTSTAEPDPAPLPDKSTTLAAKHKTLRPRLVLEPKPDPKLDTKPDSKPRLLNQGDLFPTE